MFTKAWPEQRRIFITRRIRWPVLQRPVSLFLQAPPSSTNGPWWHTIHMYGDIHTHVYYFLYPLTFSSILVKPWQISKSLNNILQFDNIYSNSSSPSQHHNRSSSYITAASPISNSRATIAKATVFLMWKWNHSKLLLTKTVTNPFKCCTLPLLYNPKRLWACAERYHTCWPKSPPGHNTEKQIAL